MSELHSIRSHSCESDAIPTGWRQVSLSLVADIRISNVDKKIVQNEIPVRLCNYVDVYNNEYITAALHFMEGSATASEITRFAVEVGDVMITKDSETPDDIGVPSVALWSDARLVCGYHLALIKPDKEQVEPVFLAKQLRLPKIAAYYSRLASGSTRYGLPNAGIAQTPLCLPPLPDQRKIARILTTLDNVIEKTEALIAKYQAIKRGMMHDLFTRGIDENGQLRPPQSEAPELYKQSELGWIPRKWEAQKLGEALQTAGGYLQTGPFGSQLHSFEYVTEGIPVVMPQDITAGRILTDKIARITQFKADSMARHRLRFNDVVFSRRGDLSRAAAISQVEEGWICGTGCFLLRCVPERLDANWIARQYAMPHVQRQVDANAVGSTMPSLNNAVMERLLMLIPSQPEQVEIGRRFVAHESVHENLYLQLYKSALVKSGLMQDLLTGKVRVRVDDVEEAVE